MRYSLPAFCTLLCVLSGAGPAAADAAAQKDGTIHTTILIRSKAEDCPAGFVIFRMDSKSKMPSGSKLCFVRTPKAESNTGKK